MVVCSASSEMKAAVPPARMFKALFVESHNLFPKVMPEHIKSVDVVQGQAGCAGSVEQTNFPEGSPFKYVKNRLDHVDTQNLVCKYTMIEGDLLGEHIEYVVNEVKVEPSSDGGCVLKMKGDMHTKGDHVIKEDEIKEGNEQTIGMYKAVETCLLINEHNRTDSILKTNLHS